MSPAISHDLENLKILSQESKTSEKASKNSGFKMPPKIDPSMLPADEKEEISEKPKRVGGFKVPDSVANDLEKISAFEGNAPPSHRRSSLMELRTNWH